MTDTVFNKILVCAFAAFLVFAFLYYNFHEFDPVFIMVRNGHDAKAAAGTLKRNGLIRSAYLFRAASHFFNGTDIKPGVYEFTKKDNIFTILKKLKNGSDKLMDIYVPPGKTVKQTADIFEKTALIDRSKFIEIASGKDLEGYLMPGTYQAGPYSSEDEIAGAMLAEFNKKVTPDLYERAESIKMPMKDILILASIIEKETLDPEESTVISGVFHNRLNTGMKLQSCVTVMYATGVEKVRISRKDTKFDSPYNTYIIDGLPPAPICSPGLGSIRTALYPAETKNLFFVTTEAGDGRHFFAETFEEHKKNVKISKKNQKKR